MPIPQAKAYVFASRAGTEMSTGVLSGKGLLTFKSGRTTSVAHVLSDVRTNSSVAGEPFAMVTVLGVYPFSSATILMGPVAGAPGVPRVALAGGELGIGPARSHAVKAPTAVVRMIADIWFGFMFGSP